MRDIMLHKSEFRRKKQASQRLKESLITKSPPLLF